MNAGPVPELPPITFLCFSGIFIQEASNQVAIGGP